MGDGKVEFAEKLRKVVEELPFLSKDSRNNHHNYSYVSEAKVKAEVRAAFQKHGLLLSGVDMCPHEGSTPLSAVVHVRLHVSDGVNSAAFEGVGGDSDKSGKAVMKATAAAIKYALTTAFLIPTGDDPEGSQDGKATRGRAVGAGGDDW